LVITAEVNEKLLEMIRDKVVPEVKRLSVSPQRKQALKQDPTQPLCVLVFDREAYSLEFFEHLWLVHRIAVYMFSRWRQENFFWYMRQDYALDAIADYTVNELDGKIKVVNPMYSKLTQKLKKQEKKCSVGKLSCINWKHKMSSQINYPINVV